MYVNFTLDGELLPSKISNNHREELPKAHKNNLITLNVIKLYIIIIIIINIVYYNLAIL